MQTSSVIDKVDWSSINIDTNLIMNIRPKGTYTSKKEEEQKEDDYSWIEPEHHHKEDVIVVPEHHHHHHEHKHPKYIDVDGDGYSEAQVYDEETSGRKKIVKNIVVRDIYDEPSLEPRVHRIEEHMTIKPYKEPEEKEIPEDEYDEDDMDAEVNEYDDSTDYPETSDETDDEDYADDDSEDEDYTEDEDSEDSEDEETPEPKDTSIIDPEYPYNTESSNSESEEIVDIDTLDSVVETYGATAEIENENVWTEPTVVEQQVKKPRKVNRGGRRKKVED